MQRLPVAVSIAPIGLRQEPSCFGSPTSRRLHRKSPLARGDGNAYTLPRSIWVRVLCRLHMALRLLRQDAHGCGRRERYRCTLHNERRFSSPEAAPRHHASFIDTIWLLDVKSTKLLLGSSDCSRLINLRVCSSPIPTCLVSPEFKISAVSHRIGKKINDNHQHHD